MKRLNSKANSILVKSLASSILFTSCSQDVDIEQLVDKSQEDFDITNSKGVSLALTLSEDTKQALREIAPLVQEIIDNPHVAKELTEDPEAFCKKRGYNFVIDLDDAMFKVIIALGDNEINEALRNSDIEKFIQLCAEKHLLDEGQSVRINAVFQDDKEQELFNSIAEQLNGEPLTSRGVTLWAVISLVLVIAVVITYTIGTEDDAKKESPKTAHEINHSLINSPSYQQQSTKSAFLHCSNPDYSVLDVWALKNKQIANYQLVSGYKTFLAQQIVSYLKANKPQVFENFSEVQITEFLLKNMVV